MSNNRYNRQIKFFGEEGQKILNNTSVGIVGVGGLGSHLAQQLSYLGVGSILLIDDDVLEESNLNRLVGATINHEIGTPKVAIANECITKINPSIEVDTVRKNLLSKKSFRQLKELDFVFGSVDNDGARLVLNEYCLAYKLPYIDSATGIVDQNYGGRVAFVENGERCLYCLNKISSDEARKVLQSEEARKDEADIYGLTKDELDISGPSVISLNGIIASLAVTEFLVEVTGIRPATPLLEYKGTLSTLIRDDTGGNDNCYYCNTVYGQGKQANIERYLS